MSKLRTKHELKLSERMHKLTHKVIMDVSQQAALFSQQKTVPLLFLTVHEKSSKDIRIKFEFLYKNKKSLLCEE